MTKIFKTPFAAQGDRVAIPNEVQPDGAVSYTQGYGYDYERDQNVNPAAKDIEREKMNGIFHDITEAVGEIQTFGVAKWSLEAQPYPLRAVVYHNQKLWQSRIENNKEDPQAGKGWMELKADLTAGDVGAYNKEEANQRFQPLGNYTPAGYSYNKEESNTRFQPKGNYQPAGNYALKGESYTKPESDAKYQPMGNYQIAGDYATNATVNGKLDKSAIVQTTGQSANQIMSQKAVTDALANAVSIDVLYPIGIVLWFAQNKNPNNLFPGTSWRYVGENRTVRLATANGSNVLSTGGSDTVTLTVNNLPAHSHGFSGTTSSFDYGTKTTSWGGVHSHIYRWAGDWGHGSVPVGQGASASHQSTTDTAGGHDHTVNIGTHSHSFSGNTSNVGGGRNFSIVNSYITLMGWYRIS